MAGVSSWVTEESFFSASLEWTIVSGSSVFIASATAVSTVAIGSAEGWTAFLATDFVDFGLAAGVAGLGSAYLAGVFLAGVFFGATSLGAATTAGTGACGSAAFSFFAGVFFAGVFFAGVFLATEASA